MFRKITSNFNVLRSFRCGSLSYFSSKPSIGVIIIGDEILKGQVSDTNSTFLAKKLFSLGISLSRISVIPDNLDEIANETRLFSLKYTHVITSGGIGPTHDDLTFEGVAKAFDEKTYLHPILSKTIQDYFNESDFTSPKFKLATVPQSAELIYPQTSINRKKSYPVVKVQNIFILPGVPILLERGFGIIEHILSSKMNKCVKYVYINVDELSLTPIIDKIVSKFSEDLIVGSYPNFNNDYYKVKLSLETENFNILKDVSNYIIQLIPAEKIVNYYEDPIANAAKHVYELASTQSHILESIKVIEECIERYSQDEISLAFNGGKDCTVLLHLTHAVMRKKYPDNNFKIKAFYIRKGKSFPEVELFIKKSIEHYNLDLVPINGSLKESLEKYKEIKPEVISTLMGTRSTDPYSSSLTTFSPTDSDWPSYMRVCPILPWSYSEIWSFLRSLCIPYCSLYDVGYTSLGSMDNSFPNIVLQEIDNCGLISYKPAYLLTEEQYERDGRST